MKVTPKTICSIKTADGFYKIIRVFPTATIDNSFLLSKFTFGHISLNDEEKDKGIARLVRKESVLCCVHPATITVRSYTIDKNLSELCQIDKDGTIVKHLNSAGEWEDSQVRGANSRPPKKKTFFYYDLDKLQKTIQEEIAKIEQEPNVLVDFYALGKTFALSNPQPVYNLYRCIDYSIDLIEKMTELDDLPLFENDIKYHEGVVDGYSILLDIIKSAPLFTEQRCIKYVIYLEQGSEWNSYFSELEEWKDLNLISKTSISSKYYITNSIENAKRLMQEGDCHTKFAVLLKNGEGFPEIPAELPIAFQITSGKKGKPITDMFTSFYNPLLQNVYNMFSIERFFIDTKSLKNIIPDSQ